MTIFKQKIVLVFLTLLILFAATAAYLQQPFVLIIPFAIIAGYYLLQYPVHLFYLLMASLPWSIEYQITPALGTDLPDEPFMWLASLAALIILCYRNKEIQFKLLHPLLLVLLLQVIWIVLILPFSSNVLVSTKYLLAKLWYLLAFVVLPVFLFRDKEVVKKSVLVLTTSMMLFVLYALVRHAAFDFSFEKINTALEPFYRNHVNYSALLVCIIPLLFVFLQSTDKRWMKVLISILLLFAIAAVFLSYARGAWLALAAGVVAYWLLKKRLLFVSYFIVLAMVAGSVLLLVQNNNYLKYAHSYNTTIFHSNFTEHLAATYQLKDVSTAERYNRWIAGVRMSADNWQTGFGPNTFYENYKPYTVPAFKTWVSNNEEKSTVHTYFLLLLVEQGVIGLILFLTLIGAMFWWVQKCYHQLTDNFWKNAMAVVAVVLPMVCVLNFLSDLIETDKIGSVFYLCVAAIISATKLLPQKNN